MIMIDSFFYMFFSGISFIALLIVLNLLLPGKVERIREKLEGHYVRSFVIGLITLGLSFAILLLLYYIITLPIYGLMEDPRRPITYIIILEHLLIPITSTLLIILVALGFVSICTIGLAALSKSLGQRIRNVRPSLSPDLIGATLMVLSGLVPFIGWFIFTPIALCLSFGSTIQILFRRKVTPKTLE